jgi:hypothetical protein
MPTYKVLATVATYVTVTSEQRMVSQNDLVVLLEVKTIALYSNDARCLNVTPYAVTLDAAAISSNYIT